VYDVAPIVHSITTRTTMASNFPATNKNKRQKKNQGNDKKLRVVIVEDHHHALEHIHAALRSFKQLKLWKMIHFDAHPDLAVSPQIPAVACYQPHLHGLYEQLDDSNCGIAEWILPLVFAANLRHIHWIRSDFSDQFENGVYNFQVGGVLPSSLRTKRCIATDSAIETFHDIPDDAVLNVSLEHRYYLEDLHHSVTQPKDMILPQHIELTVSSLDIDQVTHGQTEKVISDNVDRWMLDLCLDYFACLNPFYSELEALDANLANGLQELVMKVQFGTTTTNASAQQVNATVASFYKGLTEFLTCFRSSQPLTQNVRTEYIQLIKGFFDPNDENVDIPRMINGIEHSIIRASYQPVEKLIDCAIKALPYLNLPHDRDSAFLGRCVDKVSAAISVLKDWLRPTDIPFLVTIARSSRDGYTPPNVVENLQSKILQEVHDIFCDCDGSINDFRLRTSDTPSFSCSSRCKCEVIFDYGKWEGTYEYAK